MNKSFQLLITSVLLTLSLPAGAESWQKIGTSDLAEWEERSFDGQTTYSTVSLQSRRAIKAECRDSASGLYIEKEINLNKKPLLKWSWKVENVYGSDLDETTKSGDDYPARIYLIADSSWYDWQPTALNYVWATNQSKGSTWTSAFTDQVKMIAVESGDGSTGEWQTYTRNIRRDFERSFDSEIRRLEAIAIMTDCDNSGSAATTFYGPIYLGSSEHQNR
jgi:hypothetical protein